MSIGASIRAARNGAAGALMAAELRYGFASSIEGMGIVMTVRPPKTANPYIDRYLDCQMAAEDAFRGLVDAIMAAGWSEDEAAYAVTGLAQAHLLARAANDETDAQIRRARQLRNEI
jgi:hypothetical protein